MLLTPAIHGVRPVVAGCALLICCHIEIPYDDLSRLQGPLRMYPVKAARPATKWQLRLRRGGWAAISRVLAAGLPQRPDELPPGTGAHGVLSLSPQLLWCHWGASAA